MVLCLLLLLLLLYLMSSSKFNREWNLPQASIYPSLTVPSFFLPPISTSVKFVFDSLTPVVRRLYLTLIMFLIFM